MDTAAVGGPSQSAGPNQCNPCCYPCCYMTQTCVPLIPTCCTCAGLGICPQGQATTSTTKNEAEKQDKGERGKAKPEGKKGKKEKKPTKSGKATRKAIKPEDPTSKPEGHHKAPPQKKPPKLGRGKRTRNFGRNFYCDPLMGSFFF